MINLKIEGLDTLKASFAQGADQIQEEVKSAMVQSTNMVKIKARDLAPYKTGALQKSIFSKIEDNGFTGVVAQDLNVAWYGYFQEYGTRFMKGTPHMRPAFEQNVAAIESIFEKAVDNVLEKIANS